MFETTSLELCEALKKTFVPAWVTGAPSEQAQAASRYFKEANGAFIGSDAFLFGVPFSLPVTQSLQDFNSSALHLGYQLIPSHKSPEMQRGLIASNTCRSLENRPSSRSANSRHPP